MKKIEKISPEELKQIKEIVGEAFVSNELFHEFGCVSERKDLVRVYMDAYVECVYESGQLYGTEDGQGYIGLGFSQGAPLFPKLKMLFCMVRRIPWKTMKKFMKHVRQIAGANEKYDKLPHIDILMVCVKKESQGKGIARQLVEYAQKMAGDMDVPLLFDTDMPEYAQMYQHLGCVLYNQVTAENGVTRYNLVWEKKLLDERTLEKNV